MSETIIELGDVERVAATLDVLCRDLPDEDRAVLHAVFARAGAAAAGDDDEVSGFTISWKLDGGVENPNTDQGGLFSSFQYGVGRRGFPGIDMLNPQPLPP